MQCDHGLADCAGILHPRNRVPYLLRSGEVVVLLLGFLVARIELLPVALQRQLPVSIEILLPQELRLRRKSCLGDRPERLLIASVCIIGVVLDRWREVREEVRPLRSEEVALPIHAAVVELRRVLQCVADQVTAVRDARYVSKPGALTVISLDHSLRRPRELLDP